MESVRIDRSLVGLVERGPSMGCFIIMIIIIITTITATTITTIAIIIVIVVLLLLFFSLLLILTNSFDILMWKVRAPWHLNNFRKSSDILMWNARAPWHSVHNGHEGFVVWRAC